MNYKNINIKVLALSFLTTLIFYCLIEIFTKVPEKTSIEVPKNWQKMELTLVSNYFVGSGEMVSLLHTNGSILLPRVLLLSSEKTTPPWSEQSRDNFLKVLIATPKLSLNQWQEIHTKNPQDIYLSPLLAKNDLSSPHLIKRKNYELFY